MDVARPEFKTQKRRRQLFMLAAVILGVAAVSVGVSRLKPAGRGEAAVVGEGKIYA